MSGSGGSWKVAYADFVTSMFALFLVLWIIGADEETRRAVEDYFQGRKINTNPGERGITEMQQDKIFRTIPQDTPSKDMVSINELQQALEQVRQQLKNSSEDGEDQIRFDYTADGVRITAIDRAKRPFFEPNSSKLTAFGSFVLQTIGWQIERLPVQVEIEGHTEKGAAMGALGAPVGNADQTTGQGGLQGWELSTERAISSEKELGDSGVKSAQFFRVAGKGDSDPIDPAHPENEDNRRIAIVIRPGKGESPESFREKMQP